MAKEDCYKELVKESQHRVEKIDRGVKRISRDFQITLKKLR